MGWWLLGLSLLVAIVVMLLPSLQPRVAASDLATAWPLPGRSPRWADFRDDMIVIAAGWAVAMLLLWLVRRMFGWAR